MARRKKDAPGLTFPKPAPGDLETIQGFVNTGRTGGEPDVLATPRDLVRWLANRGLVPTGTELTDEERLRTLEVRAGLYAMLRSNSGAALDREVVRVLDDLAVEPPPAGGCRAVLAAAAQVGTYLTAHALSSKGWSS